MKEYFDIPKIDAHSHVGDFGHPFNFCADGPSLLATMDKFRVERSILTAPSADANALTAALCKANPDRFVPVMWCDASRGQPVYDELERYLRDEGFKGAKLQSLFDGYAVDAPCVDPIAELCEAYHVPLFVHSGHEPFALPWQIGLLAERHPNVPMVMLHMGHGHGIYVEAALTMAKRYDNLYLETSGTSMSCQIRNACENVGRDRVMFGLDMPFHAPEVEIMKVAACGVDDDCLERVFYRNAADLLARFSGKE